MIALHPAPNTSLEAGEFIVATRSVWSLSQLVIMHN
jgi:hypothetical protein